MFDQIVHSWGGLTFKSKVVKSKDEMSAVSKFALR